MPRKGAVLLLIPVLVGGCSLSRPLFDDPHRTPYPAHFPELPQGPSLDVLVMGDWGTGGPGQRRVSRAIEDAYRFDPPDLVLSTGDNFYPHGVKDTEDPLWRRTFRNVYSGPFWDSLTFYPVLGNHDREGNPLAQIQYSDVDPRWRMVDFHYAFRKPLPEGGTVLFLALDTQPMQGERNGSVQQIAWIDSVLTASEDRWVVTFGHHPLATGGRHKQSEHFRERIIPLLESRSYVYFSGHNHSLEVLPASPDLLQAVCGGGGGRDNDYVVRDTDDTLFSFTNGGWCYLRIFPEALVVELYNRDGALRFRYLIRGSRGFQTDGFQELPGPEPS